LAFALLMRDGEALNASFAGTLLRMELDRVPLWRNNHVAVKQLVEDFARYPYLPRLKNPDVLVAAIKVGASLLAWAEETFAYADSFDELTGRYRGLRHGRLIGLTDADSPGLVVKSHVARAQIDAERAATEGKQAEGGPGIDDAEDDEKSKVDRRSKKTDPPGQRPLYRRSVSMARSRSMRLASAGMPAGSPRR
jgi:hypothetical protein